MERIKHILTSLKLNYKSWIFFLLVVYFLSDKNYLLALLNFIIFLFISYAIHFVVHMKSKDFFIYNIHTYHHNYSNWFSFYTELLFEFIFSTGFTFIKLFFQMFCQGECKISSFSFLIDKISIPLNLFICMIYISIHFINYSLFNVNNIHQLHHKDVHTNYFPDICDIIFNTKYKIENTIENTDHYIPNIIISYLIIALFITIIKSSRNYKETFSYFFIYFYIISLIIIYFSSIYIYNRMLNKSLKKDYKKFCKL